jgi:hypothetical protein
MRVANAIAALQASREVSFSYELFTPDSDTGVEDL